MRGGEKPAVCREKKGARLLMCAHTTHPGRRKEGSGRKRTLPFAAIWVVLIYLGRGGTKISLLLKRGKRGSTPDWCYEPLSALLPLGEGGTKKVALRMRDPLLKPPVSFFLHKREGGERKNYIFNLTDWGMGKKTSNVAASSSLLFSYRIVFLHGGGRKKRGRSACCSSPSVAGEGVPPLFLISCLTGLRLLCTLSIKEGGRRGKKRGLIFFINVYDLRKGSGAQSALIRKRSCATTSFSLAGKGEEKRWR